ncbi:metal-dependent hydrolase [Geoglobus acetivorans]|uniref:Metal-dependent hydrolase n=1 Tax=Geoglobus acetivorans TaxID=565033 RepID=A0ABZ3H346_GEOAI|nr:metal-dependent hydrolase [Geoglobus acetivorans]
MLLFGHIGITLGIFWFAEEKFGFRFDYRLVVFASLLPDIIDKLIGRVILPIGTGRLIGHTLLFILILTLISVRRKNLLPLPLASFVHLLEDEMWNYPATSFWPLFGNFRTGENISFQEYIMELLKQYEPSLSYTFISEVIGFIIILVFFLKKKMRAKLNA